MRRIERFCGRWVLLTFLATAMTCTLHAQSITGEITGAVIDSTGAVIPAATVTLINSDTGATVRTVTSDSKGTYTVPLLQVGTYTVTGSKDGFNTSKAEGIQLHVSDSLTVDLKLSIRDSNATVTVTSETQLAPQLESAAQSSVISGKEMTDLALNTRNFEQMIQLQPGVSFGGDSDQTYSGMVSPAGTSNNANLSINGQRATQNAYLFDGTDMLAHGSNNQVSIFPTIDSIQEMKVVRDSYGAEYGGGGSAQVQIISKSGGSAFHGDMYVFVRNSAFDAYNFFAKRTKIPLPKPEDSRYVGGISIGGPIYIPKHLTRFRDNTFFFYSLAVTRATQGLIDNVLNDPTPAQIAGNFGTSTVCIAYTPSCVIGTQVTNIDPVAAAYIKDILSTLPAPNVDPVNLPQELILTQIGKTNETQQLVRIDHTFNQRLSMFFRYVHDPINVVAPFGYNKGNGYPGVSNSYIPTVGDGYMLHGTYALTNATILDAAFSFQPFSIQVIPTGLMASQNSPDIRPNLPFTSTLTHIPTISINNGAALAAVGPTNDSNRTYQAFANVFHVFGQHSVSTGINFEHMYENVNQGDTNAGLYKFTSGNCPSCSGTAFAQSFANFLTGHVANFTQSTIDPLAQSRANLYEAYIQDDWKILPRLTLNLGVRYSFSQMPTDAGGHLGAFDPKFYDPSLAPTIQGGAGSTTGNICAALPCTNVVPNPAYVAGSYDGVIRGGVNSPYGNAVSNQPKLDFAPRAGFAFDVFGGGKTSLRGGFGIFYNQVPLSVVQTAVNNNPFYSSNLTFTGGTFTNPGAGTNSALIPPNAFGISSNWKTPYSMAYSLGIQQQMQHGFLLDIRYVGNNSRHLVGQVDINQPHPLEYVTAGIIPGNSVTTANTVYLNQIRPYKGYGPILSEVPEFTSNYNGLQVEANRKLGTQSRISVNYTWSRSLTDSLADSGAAPQNSYDPKAEYGLAAIDRRHVFTGHFVYHLPFYASQKGWKGHLLGGYEFSGIVTMAAGKPLTTLSNTPVDPAGQGVLAGGAIEAVRPNQIGDPNSDAPHAPDHLSPILTWFNITQHFTLAPSASLPGNERSGAVRGPGYQVWNIDFFKNLALTSGTHLQFRVEAANVFNHTNWTTIQMQLNNLSAGQATAARDARTMQVGAKYIF